MALTILVQGAGGALGRAAVQAGLNRKWRVIAVAHAPVLEASSTVVIPKHATIHQQYSAIAASLGDQKVDAIFCLAGGFVAGDVHNAELLSQTEAMFRSSVEPAFLAVKLAADQFVHPGGLVVLPGSAAVARPTPWGLAYGSAKSAVHHLVRSLKDAPFRTIGIAPVTLDTPANRLAMASPSVDYSTWTPIEVVAKQLCDWVDSPLPHADSGTVYKIVTSQFSTHSFVSM